jgi:hypothetical protein
VAAATQPLTHESSTPQSPTTIKILVVDGTYLGDAEWTSHTVGSTNERKAHKLDAVCVRSGRSIATQSGPGVGPRMSIAGVVWIDAKNGPSIKAARDRNSLSYHE